MTAESTEPAEFFPTSDVERTPRQIPRWVRDVAVVLIAIAAGFGSSYLHPGPRGHVGPQGPQGIMGPQGVAGPAGNDASSQHLGVCLSTSTWNTGYANWPSLLSDITITSPGTSNDGTVSCGLGNFVPVTPQK